jgi:hypothetical protein
MHCIAPSDGLSFDPDMVGFDWAFRLSHSLTISGILMHGMYVLLHAKCCWCSSSALSGMMVDDAWQWEVVCRCSDLQGRGDGELIDSHHGFRYWLCHLSEGYNDHGESTNAK